MSKSRILTEQSPNWVEKVWRKNASQIYKLCCARSKDTEHAKDLFQEVALRFCRSATVLDHDKPIFPWFMTVIRNTNRDLHRKTRRMVRLTEVMEAGAKYSAGKIEQEICENRRFLFVRNQLDDLMKPLTVPERMAVEFSSIGGIRADEACLFCGTDKGTFFKRKASAFKKMREKRDIYLSLLKKSDSASPKLDELLARASEFS